MPPRRAGPCYPLFLTNMVRRKNKVRRDLALHQDFSNGKVRRCCALSLNVRRGDSKRVKTQSEADRIEVRIGGLRDAKGSQVVPPDVCLVLAGKAHRVRAVRVLLGALGFTSARLSGLEFVPTSLAPLIIEVRDKRCGCTFKLALPNCEFTD